MQRSRKKKLRFYDQHETLMEDVPNEILLQVFSHLQPEHLFKAFGNLNSRFCALIRSAFVRYQVTADNVHLLSVIKASQLKSMVVNELFNLNMVMNYFRKNHLTQLERLDFTFVDLQSVRIFLEFLPKLDNLKYLRIDGNNSSKYKTDDNFIENLTQLPFSAPFSTRLRHFELIMFDLITYYEYIPKPNPLSILEYFSIHSICLNDLATILTWMPQIKFLKILYAFKVNDDKVQLQQDDLTSRSLIKMPQNLSLRRLEIGICHGVTCRHMGLLLANLTELRRFNCLVWSEHALVLEQWIRIFLQSKIDRLRLTLMTPGRLMNKYLSAELQADIWCRQIFNTTIFTNVSGGICLEAHGLNVARISAASDLDDQSSNEHQNKKQRTN